MLLNFSIPEDLYKQINDYDVVKPKPVKKAKKTSTFPKAGIPENLIPPEIFPKEMLLNAISDLNNTQTSNNFNSIRSLVFEHNNKHIAISKEANKIWCAIWFDPSEENTIFNYTIAVRDLTSYKKHHAFHSLQLDEEDFISVTHNKKTYLYYTKQVTKDILKERKYNCKHFILKNSQTFYNELKNQIKKAILVWDGYGIFEAYEFSLAYICGEYQHKNNFDWVPTFDWIVKKNHLTQKVIEKLDTPFLKKRICLKLQEIVDYYNSPNFKHFYVTPLSQLKAFEWVNNIYGKMLSVDYCQQIWNSLNFDDNHIYRYLPEAYVRDDWFKENLPIQSFVNMMNKDFPTFKDAVDMVFDILRFKEDLVYDGRWRVDEFHDWIMGESWKLNNKNQNLPQDLFPNPVKVDKVTFIQPINTHQLSQWGRAARNCVGNSTYGDGILKKNHFIVLALENNKPHLTIQAKLENQNLKIIQIKKSCNSSLSSLETAHYHQLFSKALEIRSEQLNNE